MNPKTDIKSMIRKLPCRSTFILERALLAAGKRLILGIDEVGRGALAGPLMAAGVIFPHPVSLPRVTDSKLLTAHERECLDMAIRACAEWSLVVSISAHDIDQQGIQKAVASAFLEIIRACAIADCAVIDGLPLFPLERDCFFIVQGDRRVKTISAASIVAKVARDEYMRTLDDACPGYGFASHKGYGTADHYRSLVRLGPSIHHRQTFLKSFFPRPPKRGMS